MSIRRESPRGQERDNNGKMKKSILFASLMILVVVIVFIWPRLYNPGTPQEDCAAICMYDPKGSEWENGPCLAEAGQKGLVTDWSYYKNWVCDVAHEPRQPVDDLPENQCASFGPGRHFVEVDMGCNVIRAV